MNGKIKGLYQRNKCLSNMKSNVANNRNELSKYCRLCDSCDISFRALFNAEFPLQVMNFPIEYSTVRGQLASSTLTPAFFYDFPYNF